MSYIKIPLKNVFNVDKIVSAFELDAAPNFVFEGESHNFWELRYIVEGEIDTHYGERLYHLRAGDIFFHCPGEFHDILCDGKHSAKIIIVSFECHSTAMEYFNQRSISVPKEMRFHIFDIMKTANDCFYNVGARPNLKQNIPFGAEQLLRGEIERFLIRLVQLNEKNHKGIFFTSRDEMVDKLVSDIKEYLDERLFEKITLDEISQNFHFGKSHICHLFKEKCGTSIKQYFIKLKLDKSKSLLRDTDICINEIANKLSFESPQYYAKLFKRETGHTPTEYRNIVRK